jgi:SAM-dependent methyltransferase
MSREEAFEALRLAEVHDAIETLDRYKKSAGDLLEIGAGRGWQARALSDAGYKVEAIDLPSESRINVHASDRHWPIIDYDGVHIPFADDRFDIVYSSNVLEHVEKLDALMGEMKRVLRPGGIAVHLLPNPQWRILSLLTHYPGQAIDLVRYLRRQKSGTDHGGRSGGATMGQSKLRKAIKRLVPPTHGAVGSPIGEIGRYSKGRWDRYFAAQGWEVIHYANNGLLASGDYLLGTLLPIDARRRLGRMAGGIAHVYVLRPAGGQEH